VWLFFLLTNSFSFFLWDFFNIYGYDNFFLITWFTSKNLIIRQLKFTLTPYFLICIPGFSVYFYIFIIFYFIVFWLFLKKQC
jgi:hypothetical protein